MTFLNNLKEILQSFYMGRVYPVIVVLMMFCAYTTSTEAYINLASLLLLSVGLLVCDSLRPLIPVLISYLYQFSVNTAMPTPEGLAALFSGTSLVLYVVSFSILAICLVLFFLKNKLFTLENLKTLPLPIAAIVFSVTFLTNGIFSDRYVFTSTLYGALQIFTILGIFYIFYLGLKNDNHGELVDYLAYTTALVAILVFADTVFLYTAHGKDFISNGVIDRGLMLYGWGNCNTAGNCAAVLIPMCYYGVMKSKTPAFYFISASLAMAAAFLSTSRNALLVGGAFYVLCFIFCCFVGKSRVKFAIFASVTLAILGVAFYVFKDTTVMVMDQYIKRGLGSVERIKLWEYAVEAFKESPVFGKGFFGLWTDTYHLEWGFPTMLHNTPLQLLACSGVVGFIGYLFYRICSLKPFIIKPSLEKTMLGFAILVVLIGSLADNFVFYIPHMLYYPIAMALAFKIYDDEEQGILDYYHYITRW